MHEATIEYAGLMTTGLGPIGLEVLESAGIKYSHPYQSGHFVNKLGEPTFSDLDPERGEVLSKTRDLMVDRAELPVTAYVMVKYVP